MRRSFKVGTASPHCSVRVERLRHKKHSGEARKPRQCGACQTDPDKSLATRRKTGDKSAQSRPEDKAKENPALTRPITFVRFSGVEISEATAKEIAKLPDASPAKNRAAISRSGVVAKIFAA